MTITNRIANTAAIALLLFGGSAWATPTIWESDFGAELTDLSGEDDEETEVTLSFNFKYEGANYTTVQVGTNGGLQLGLPAGGDDGEIDYDLWDYFEEFNNDGDPDNPIIVPFNSDLDLSTTGTVHYNDFGNRAVFTWNEVGTFADEEALLTFQTQLFDTGVIIFGYNGILDGIDEDLLDSLDEGILVGISKSNGSDPGGSNLSNGPFSTASDTVYELWCYDTVNSCYDNDRDINLPGPLNTAFDLDMMNVIFTPQSGGGFAVANALDNSVPVPPTLLLIGFGLVGLGYAKRKTKA